VNCSFTYNLLHNYPITVFKGHTRTSTYIYDCVDTLANISKNFKSGEVYNIASRRNHTIEYLADLILKETGADADLVDYREHNEILTTKDKFVDASKAEKDLGHKETVPLEEGVRRTVAWMKEFYRLED